MRTPFTLLAILLAFPANAQTENKITVSGRAWGSIENVSATTATNAANVNDRLRVTNDSSWVRVRGDMKLTDDISVWGQVEAQFALDGIGAGPFDATRNTGVGFTSKKYGTLFVGRWDTPYKIALIRLDPWQDTTIQNYAAIVGQLPQTGNLYDARFSNSVQYWSPVYQGFQVKASFEVNEDKSVGSAPAAINPWALSASVTYDGPFYVGVTYETRKDCGGAGGTAAPSCTGAQLGTHGRDWGLRAGAGYNYKPTFTEVGLIWERLESQADFAAAPFSRTESRDAWYVSLIQGIRGPVHQIAAAFGQAGKTSGDYLPTLASVGTNDRTGATYWTVAYRYNFNKDLMIHAGYVQIGNDDNATYRFGSSGLSGTGMNPMGATYQGWVVGTRYLF